MSLSPSLPLGIKYGKYFLSIPLLMIGLLTTPEVVLHIYCFSFSEGFGSFFLSPHPSTFKIELIAS
jgi:hypothetical protein